jgi:hypothetical protein
MSPCASAGIQQASGLLRRQPAQPTFCLALHPDPGHRVEELPLLVCETKRVPQQGQRAVDRRSRDRTLDGNPSFTDLPRGRESAPFVLARRLTSAAGGANVAPGGGRRTAWRRRKTRTLDPSERKRLVNEIEKIVLENAYYIPGLWWARTIVHWAKVKNYVAPPNHFSSQKLQDVRLSED